MQEKETIRVGIDVIIEKTNEGLLVGYPDGLLHLFLEKDGVWKPTVEMPIKLNGTDLCIFREAIKFFNISQDTYEIYFAKPGEEIGTMVDACETEIEALTKTKALIKAHDKCTIRIYKDDKLINTYSRG